VGDHKLPIMIDWAEECTLLYTCWLTRVIKPSLCGLYLIIQCVYTLDDCILQVPAVYRFINSQDLNSWGVPRGYGIFHGSTTTQLLPHTHPLTKCPPPNKNVLFQKIE
jgi:hypothetical protein